jgi:hypothetical protein
LSESGIGNAAPKTDRPATTPAASKPSLADTCIVLEPAALKCEVSQTLSGARSTVVQPARETADGLKILSKAEFEATGLKWEEFLAKAKTAAAKKLEKLEPSVVKDGRGLVLYIKLHGESPLISSMILCPELLTKFSPQLGNSIVALVPDRFTVYLFPRQTGEFARHGTEIAEIFTKATFPASAEAFEISESGFKSIGTFNTGDSE